MMYPVIPMLIVVLTPSSLMASTLLNPATLGNTWKQFTDSILGVEAFQDYFNELDFKSDNLMGAETVAKLKNALANKIDGNVQALMDLSNAVEASFQEPEVSFPECCKLNDDDLEYYPRLRKKIDFENPCLRYAKYGDRGGRMLSDSVLSVMKTNFEKNRELKWQYFGSEEGVFTFYPGTSRALCDDYDHRFRPWYVETATPEPKNVVIVMDASGSMQRAFPHCEQQGTLMHIAKSASIDVLRTMNPIDKVGVIAFSDGVRVPSGDDETSDCYGYQLASATPLNINYLISDFVNTISDNGDTHYITAFEKAFDLLEASQPVEGELQRDQVILFLTDGEPTDGGESVSLLEKKRNIIHTIVRRNAKMNNEVVIFTFGLGEDPDHQFLRHIAEQDGTVYNVQRNNTAGEVTPGHYKHVSDACKLRTIMASYYDFFSHRTQQSDAPVFSVPYQGATGTGLMTTVALPVKYDGQLKGVVGVDITLDDLLSDVTFFKEGDLSYAFIYESGTKAEGRTLMHPLAPAPIRIQDDPVFVHIWSLERDNIFRSNIYGNVTSGHDSSPLTFHSKRTMSRGNWVKEGVRVFEVESTYFCDAVVGSEYVVCLVLAVGDSQTDLDSEKITTTGHDFLYHKYDLASPQQPCQHLDRFSTIEKSTVQFGTIAFNDPIKFMIFDEDDDSVTRFQRYMNDNTGDVIDDDFKEGIRSMVWATSKVDDLWKESDDVFSMKEYVYYRHLVTENGVYRRYPGMMLKKTFPATQTSWYQRAKSNVGRITLSPPFDVTGNKKFAITMSHTITLSQPSNQEKIMGAMSMDVDMDYFYYILNTTYPQCNEESYSCFIMDNSGYLVVHPDFFVNSGKNTPDVVDIHVSEIEPTIAKDLLRQGFLIKQECVDLQYVKYLHFHEVHLQTHLSDADNLDDDNACKLYELTHIPGSNAFLGIVKKVCHEDISCCSCFTSRCQNNCQSQCECPCRSPADYDYCNDFYEFTSDDAPSCTPGCHLFESYSFDEDIVLEHERLPVCVQVDCALKTQSECIFSSGCQWCSAHDNADEDDIEQDGRCVTTSVQCNGKNLTTTSNVSRPSPHTRIPVYVGIGGGLVVIVVCIVLFGTLILKRRGLKKQRRQRQRSSAPSTRLDPVNPRDNLPDISQSERVAYSVSAYDNPVEIMDNAS